MDQDICYLSAREALSRFRDRSLSPVELMEAVARRIEAVNPAVNAFTHTYLDEAMSQARAAEQRYMGQGGKPRALEGLPVCIKDETTIRGQNTTSGSLIFKDKVDDRTSFSVDRILRAGGIVHARSTAPEFCIAAVTHSKLWGVTRNPWHTDYTPGGSSGGSAAALAAGMSTLANGSDIGGSIRIPASCCGVVGYKPPYGRVPEDPPFNFDYYCHEGPLARTVMDTALLANVMSGPHPKDITTLRQRLRIPDELPDARGLRVAWSMDLGYCAVDEDVRRNTLAALDAFRELGASVEEVEVGWNEDVLTAWMNHCGHLFGAMIAEHLSRHRDLMTGYARSFAEFGRTTSAADFVAAITEANRMYERFGPLLERHDVFICPTTALPAVAAGHEPSRDTVCIAGRKVEPVLGWCMTYPFNILARCPVISVPSGHSRDGVPTGIQIVARTYDDLRVFRAAAAFERARPWLQDAAHRPSLAAAG